MSSDILLALGQRLDEITSTCVPAGKPVSIALDDEESASHDIAMKGASARWCSRARSSRPNE